MTNHYFDSFLILGYVLSPLVAYLVYWIWKRIGRLRGKEADGEGGEGDA